MPEGAPRPCTVSRHEGVPTQQPTLVSPIAVPKIFVTILLAPDRPSGGGDGHELATWHCRWPIGGGNPGS